MGVISLALFGGCQSSGPRLSGAPTQADRLMQAYPELKDGRFAVIADFEQPMHAELVQLVSVSPHARCVVEAKKGRRETGKACLSFTTGSPDDTVLLNNKRASQWYLKRDWRAFDLLLVAIHAPRPGLTLSVSIVAGSADQRREIATEQALDRGWNSLRLDLGDVGEHIPLDDIQEITFSASGTLQPTTLLIDDLILTSFRRTLLGSPENKDGGLYVQRVGRRWNVGAGGRFELSFSHGQIVAWYNVSADPLRLRNLVQGTTLGPTPIVVSHRKGLDQASLGSGRAVAVRPSIVEMNLVRVVLTSEWQFLDDESGSPAPASRRWTYTVYPTGQVYTEVGIRRGGEALATSDIGLATTFVASTADSLQTFPAVEPEAKGRVHRPAFALARVPKARSVLQVIAGQSPSGGQPAQIVEQFDPTTRHASFVVIPNQAMDRNTTQTVELVVADGEQWTKEEAWLRAADYGRPSPIRLELGTPADPDGDRPTRPALNQASGSYRIVPDLGRVRFVIEGDKGPVFSPAFVVDSGPNQRAWVYVNNLTYDRTAHDRDGNLLFQLPGVIRSHTVVEVLFRQ